MDRLYDKLVVIYFQISIFEPLKTTLEEGTSLTVQL